MEDLDRSDWVTTPIDWGSDSWDSVDEGDIDSHIDDLELFLEELPDAPATVITTAPPSLGAVSVSPSSSSTVTFVEDDSNKACPPQKRTASHSKTRNKRRILGGPKRPLSAYNFFFKEQHVILSRKDSPVKYGFMDYGSVIGERWKQLEDDKRAKYIRMAVIDGARYRSEMEAFKKYVKQKKQNKALQRKKQNLETEDKCKLKLTMPETEEARLVSDGTAAHHPTGRMVPPDTIVTLPDEGGKPCQYRLSYTLYSMSLEDAEAFMARMTSSPVGETPTLPEGARVVVPGSSPTLPLRITSTEYRKHPMETRHLLRPRHDTMPPTAPPPHSIPPPLSFGHRHITPPFMPPPLSVGHRHGTPRFMPPPLPIDQRHRAPHSISPPLPVNHQHATPVALHPRPRSRYPRGYPPMV